MSEQPYVVVVMTWNAEEKMTGKAVSLFAFRFATEKAASAAAEFWSMRGAAAVIYDGPKL
jgi:hypothetical protein